MRTIHARNVNEAYAVGMNALQDEGEVEESRNGPVLVMPSPVTTTYTRPCERVLFNPERDANPFFHFMEGLWMLAGRNDVAWMDKYNSSFKKYSDDGETYHGAYGYRWRSWFSRDQIADVIQILKKNPKDRRAVLTMWDPVHDLNQEGLDFPCNLSIAFRITGNKLDITVFNRSNDIIWGCYGANAVHMSMLQEYMAAMIGVEVGRYYQVSNNFHAYMETLNKVGVPDPGPRDPYDTSEIFPYRMMHRPEDFDRDLQRFMVDPPKKVVFVNSFFYEVAVPMAQAQLLFKLGDRLGALNACGYIMATDWRKACEEWIKRRMLR